MDASVMRKSLSSDEIDEIVRCVKNIADNSRCIVCDKLEGRRMRYSCGHTACGDCVDASEECTICYFRTRPVLDEVQTQQVSIASALLSTCQETFHVDVYRRHRTSEQLKIERDLFPKCIQAPNKYSNKKKNLNSSISNKENFQKTSSFSEDMSFGKPNVKKSTRYVDEWLDKQDFVGKRIRKPFSDINVNRSVVQNKGYEATIKKRADVILQKVYSDENIIKKANPKTRNRRSIVSKEKKHVQLAKYNKVTEKDTELDLIKELRKDNINSKFSENNAGISDKDESGIVIDDEPILIEDSQTQTVDKDELAFLAVLEADKNAPQSSSFDLRSEFSETERHTPVVEETSKACQEQTQLCTFSKKVPFYKKASLFEVCQICNGDEKDTLRINTSKDVSITVDSRNFIAVIKVSIHDNPTESQKPSVSVQAEVNIIDNPATVDNIQVINKHSSEMIRDHENQSPDIFTDEVKNVKKSNKPFKTGHIFIEESDSDEDVHGGNLLEVTADVHRSSDQIDYGILSEIEKNEPQNRKRRMLRSETPGSTDSSDKENRDPNRPKKNKSEKKCGEKK